MPVLLELRGDFGLAAGNHRDVVRVMAQGEEQGIVCRRVASVQREHHVHALGDTLADRPLKEAHPREPQPRRALPASLDQIAAGFH